jgi:DNA-binding cell septation regulator SpoVG
MPRRYKQGADGQPHPAFYGKLPEEFSKADTMRFMVETDLKLSGCVSADTLAALRAEGYDYKDGNLVPAGKEETMQEKVANTTPAAPLKLDVSVRVIEPVKNLMGFASVKFNDCFVVENLKIVQGSKGLFLGMPSQPDGKGGYRDMAYPVTKEFREQLNTAVLQAYEAKLEQMAERGSVGRASISLRRKSPAAAQSVDLGPCWPEAERRREPCHANGWAMTRPAITTENCWGAVPKRTATPIPC